MPAFCVVPGAPPKYGPDPWKVDTGIRLVEVDPYMDAATQRRSLIAFYFGTKVASGDVTSDQVIDSVLANRAFGTLALKCFAALSVVLRRDEGGQRRANYRENERAFRCLLSVHCGGKSGA